jgi:hypothetical protein
LFSKLFLIFSISSTCIMIFNLKKILLFLIVYFFYKKFTFLFFFLYLIFFGFEEGAGPNSQTPHVLAHESPNACGLPSTKADPPYPGSSSLG